MDLEVARGDLGRTRLVEATPAALQDGQARLAVATFGLSTNNITYAVHGEDLQYWRFFPAAAPEPGDDTSWGRVPVWGFGEVVETTTDQAEVGERLFGYLPMSDELVITPRRTAERTLTDTSPHRAGLPGAYNSFQRCAHDPLYRADREALQMLLYPLFFTSFVIDDYVSDHGDFDASQVVLSSASSKTAIGAALLFHDRGMRTVGLTSGAHRAFTEGLGVYDQVPTYDEVGSLERRPSVYVDISGNRDIGRAVHQRLEGVLGSSLLVGDTHWDHPPTSTERPPGVRPEFLFAPTHIAKRTGDWGADQLTAKVTEAWEHFAPFAAGWLELRPVEGPEAVRDTYLTLLGGQVDPRLGYVCTLVGERNRSR